MSAQIQGAVDSLIYILEKYFTARGNPPEATSWQFDVDCRRESDADYLMNGGSFGALIFSPKNAAIEEAIEKIPPLKEVAESVDRVHGLLTAEAYRPEMAHFADVFRRFLSSKWVESVFSGSTQSDSVTYHFGYSFNAVDPSLLAELRQSARQLAAAESLPLAAAVQEAAAIDDLVTLSQVAPLTGRSKRTLERYVREGKVPEPDVRGGNGSPHRWYWKTIRASLEGLVNRRLPEKFPGSRIL